MTTALAARLEAARQELLDLGLRNPLLNFRPLAARGVTVVGEQAAAVLDILVRRGRPMSFAALPEAPARTGWKGDPERAARRAAALGLELPAAPAPPPPPVVDLLDSHLQTLETAERLHRRLLNTYYAARTSLEEQGANILYLALGQLIWYETDASPEPRRAPLVLVPVELVRAGPAERFRVRHTGAEVEGNLSLQARLRADFGLPLPLPDDDVNLPDYLAAVAAVVAGRPRWQVQPDVLELGFFSFGRFLLYRDLDPAAWPADQPLLAHPALAALLDPAAGFPVAPPTHSAADFLDDVPAAAALHQVLEADSSQLLALLAVQEGRHLVIQGPPGTGKSQTIANLLAEAIGAGRKVLFVAEKMAALEVVKRRLDALGLGVACLELHSHKANKKALLEELQTTLLLGRPAPPAAAVQDQLSQLPRHRAALNAYAHAANAPIGRSHRSAHQVAGELLALGETAAPPELPRLPFAALATWTDADATHAGELAVRLQATLRQIGVPRHLLFWGSELTSLPPAAAEALGHALAEASAAVLALQTATAALAAHLGLPAPLDRAGAEQLLPAARHLRLAPALAGVAVADVEWHPAAGLVAAAVEAGAAHAALRRQYEPVLQPEVWDQNLTQERAALLTYGDKWWNFLIGDYRRARRRLQTLWRQPLPRELNHLLPVLEAQAEAARHAARVAAADALAARLFGPAWRGLASDWPALLRIQQFLSLTHQRISRGELPAELLPYLTRNAPPAPQLADLLAALETALGRHRAALGAVVEGLRLNEVRRFGPAGRLEFQPFDQQQAVLAGWAAGRAGLRPLLAWNNVAAAVLAEGHPELLAVAERWEPAADWLAAAVQRTWLEFLGQQAQEQHPALRQFERAGHEATAAHFRHADALNQLGHRVQVLRRHHARLPNLQASGQMGLLRHEFAKKTRHLALRRLLQEAGRAVQAIKPVFMMSPLSVAAYLPPGGVEFDLVVFDEASQVKPVEALGAIARGRQLVVVGDSKQLPPTSFFDSLTRAEDEADDDNVTADIPSILELCQARRMPALMLRWHYRSQHESLIQPSNQLFYDDHLVVFPSAGAPAAAPLGLAYHHLPDTHYERGTTRTNPLEARAVAAAVLRHARTAPHLTLGVVAFSTAQRQAIEQAVEELRQSEPAAAFFDRHAHEPFFVKNLENVQGDERDVIFISLGYGRTKSGQLAMSFGPLNGEGGERRLNVLITRARLRCEVFTNLLPTDLDLTRTAARGVAALQAFLRFAQAGRAAENLPARPATPEEPFEEVVARALRAQGYEVVPRVGSRGFYLDLAIADPAAPGRYWLGIICDGAMYAGARSARDRDRLRPAVLASRGWHLHHVWSTDWFRDPAAALARTVAAIEAARRAAEAPAAAAVEEGPKSGVEPALPALVREAPVAAPAAVAEPYQLAQLPAAVGHRALHQHGLGQLASWLALVVRIESPIHVEEAVRRLARAGGARQVGARMLRAVEAAAVLAQNLRYLRREGDFLWEISMRQPPLRDRSALPAATRKAPIAPEELARALHTVVAQSFALPREAALAAAARLLGFSRPSDELRSQLETALAELLTAGRLAEKNGVLEPAG
ncbi:DUF3320 domain-containing protein [Hymenobacter sp. NST-14]|uniref:DUF3320 domain-containing protein n=1 Tax=Hymenobacter piscis TaxID=2839984 RepID=UPI001C0297A3|nr:DUF3320 domain-containing protein [Hymenobacter piscis]MBT9392106.1 DUF3320 domain-containing protein [Hymenobacter piscis]